MAENVGVISRAAGGVAGLVSGLGSGIVGSIAYLIKGAIWPFYMMYNCPEPLTETEETNTLLWYPLSVLFLLPLIAPFAIAYSLLYNVGKGIYIGVSEGFMAGIFYPAMCFNELSSWYQAGPYGKRDGVYQNNNDPNSKVLVFEGNTPVSYMMAHLFAVFMVSSVNREVAAVVEEHRSVSSGAHEFNFYGTHRLLGESLSSSNVAPPLTVPACPQHQADRPSNTNAALKAKIATLGEPPHDRKGFQELDNQQQHAHLSRDEAEAYNTYKNSKCRLSNTPIRSLTDPVTIQWGDYKSNISVTVKLSALQKLADENSPATIEVPGRAPKNLNDVDVALCHGFRQFAQPIARATTSASSSRTTKQRSK